MANLILQGIDADALTESITEAVVERLRPVLSESAAPLLVDGDRLGELLGVSRPTVDRLRASGKIPSVLIGKRRLYNPAAVLSALESPNEKGGHRHEQ